MILWHANLGRGVSVAEFVANLRRVLDAAGPRAVYAFQEIDEADKPEEHDWLVRLTGHTHRLVGGRTAVPILVPHHLELVDEQQTLACRGLAKFTPNRVVNEAVVRLAPNLDVAVLNVHVPLNRLRTLTRRADVRKALRARARAHEAGVWVADTNTRRGWPRIAKGEQPVIDAGIDRAKAWAPEGREVVVTGRRTVNLTIDGHDAHGARVTWEPRRA